VDIILGSLAGGMSVEEVAKEYGIKKRDVLAAIEYAAKIVTKKEAFLPDKAGPRPQ